ncbi:hypothetical protein ACQRET_03200 [Streptomyces koyangensis]|uniref:hypothetical protein n=1 Tax=Streptomyces koyangensis TaxID=188770 RepID=UPI003CFF4C73
MSEALQAARTRLASVDKSPARAVRWFTSAGYAVLPLGVDWSAVRVRGRLGIDAWVRVGGPAIHDPADQAVYFLLPPDTTWWPCKDGEFLTAGQWLSVPDPARTAPPGAYWLSPLDRYLVRPETLQTALRSLAGEVVG